MKTKVLSGLAAIALAAAGAGLPALQASAGTLAAAGQLARSASAGSGVSATAASSWQTNGTVWALAPAHGVIYVGGDFTSVRRPGDPSGTGEVKHSYLAAFDASTGNVLPFNPALDGPVRALAVSPDGRTLYVGGRFSHVNGQPRRNLAAFGTTTGALRGSWTPAATGTVRTIAPSPGGSVIYIGGGFASLDLRARGFAGAVNNRGKLLAWAPGLNGPVDTIAVAPDDSRVLVGGFFTAVNGVKQEGIGSTSPKSGASEPWAATILPDRRGCVSVAKDVIVSGSTAYVAAEGTGGGCFDGDFAAAISNGALRWQNDCLGATQALAIVSGGLYKGSHAHDCAFEPGGFPQVPLGGAHHLLEQSLSDGTLGHWTPNTNAAAGGLGPYVMATDGSQLFVGGDFTTVNGKPQQGFARFVRSPDTRPDPPAAAPTVISTSAGVDSVTFDAVSDPDSGALTYSIYRDGGAAPIATLGATSWPWALPVLHYRDAGLKPGSAHTYQVAVSDGTLGTARSPQSAPVTVSSASPQFGYRGAVLRDRPYLYWRLGEKSGTTAGDSSGNGHLGRYQKGVQLGKAGAIGGSRNRAAWLDGKRGLVTSAQTAAGTRSFSMELWFKTTTHTGGELMGFGSAQTGRSSQRGRQIYMMNDGQLVFGVYAGQKEAIETPRVYNNGQWHYVVATLSATAGMALYVDGSLIGTNPATAAQVYNGYWRVGGDSLKGWSLDSVINSQGSTEPYGDYFRGSVDEVAVYASALSASRVAAHYASNALSH